LALGDHIVTHLYISISHAYTGAKVRLLEVVDNNDNIAVDYIINAFAASMIGNDQDTVDTVIHEHESIIDNIHFGKDNTVVPNDEEEEQAVVEADDKKIYP
jgi:hypothetical protein